MRSENTHLRLWRVRANDLDFDPRSQFFSRISEHFSETSLVRRSRLWDFFVRTPFTVVGTGWL
jgi:hypothetical protein